MKPNSGFTTVQPEKEQKEPITPRFLAVFTHRK
jgi:hypothetical protein